MGGAPGFPRIIGSGDTRLCAVGTIYSRERFIELDVTVEITLSVGPMLIAEGTVWISLSVRWRG